MHWRRLFWFSLKLVHVLLKCTANASAMRIVCESVNKFTGLIPFLEFWIPTLPKIISRFSDEKSLMQVIRVISRFRLLFAVQHLFIFMRPSSVGGGRILRRTLSVRLSVRPVLVFVYFFYSRTVLRANIQNRKTSVFAYGPASRMYFSARTEGRILYGHLGRTNLFVICLKAWLHLLIYSTSIDFYVVYIFSDCIHTLWLYFISYYVHL